MTYSRKDLTKDAQVAALEDAADAIEKSVIRRTKTHDGMDDAYCQGMLYAARLLRRRSARIRKH